MFSPGFWKHGRHRNKCWWSALDSEGAIAAAKEEEPQLAQLAQVQKTEEDSVSDAMELEDKNPALQEEKVGGIRCKKARRGCLYCWIGYCRADGFCHTMFSPGFWKHGRHRNKCWWSALDSEGAIAAAKEEEPQLAQVQKTEEDSVSDAMELNERLMDQNSALQEILNDMS